MKYSADVIVNIVNIVSIGAVIIFIIGTIIYIYFKLKADIAKYKEIEQDLILSDSSAPAPTNGEQGEDAQDGKDAYEIYLENNPPPLPQLTRSQYFDLFVGADGEHGDDAEIAINGSHGSDGSVGHQGGAGFKGIPGEPGIAGQRGIPGEPFFTYHADTLDKHVNQGTIMNNFKNKVVIKNYEVGSAVLENYTIDDVVKVQTIEIEWIQDPDPAPDAYASFILYENDKIIGFTEPTILRNFKINEHIEVKITAPASPNLGYRMVISFFRGMVLSSFTANIFEKQLNDQKYVFSKSPNQDIYMQPFYDILDGPSSFANIDGNYLEKIYMTQVAYGSVEFFDLTSF